MLNGHGDDRHQYKTTILYDFSSNVSPDGFSPELQNFLIKQISKVQHYPEPGCESLKLLIAKLYNLVPEQIVVTNGAMEAIYLIAQAYKNTSATIVVPTFAEYEDACSIHQLKISFLAWEDLTPQYEFKTKLIFICNPNNPTGAVLSKEFMNSLLLGNQRTVFVLDEAYIDFTSEISSSLEYLSSFPNLIIIRSLTKKFAIPGLRLGFIVSNSENNLKISKFKIPWSVNVIAAEAGKFIISNWDKLEESKANLLSETGVFWNEVNAIKGIHAFPTHTHFFLCVSTVQSAAQLKSFLIEKFGILIRDASNFRGLSPGHFRISCQKKSDNQSLVSALKTWSSNF